MSQIAVQIKLTNTLTRKKEIFTPIDPNKIGLYVCGPTVYDRAHIGNARAVVVFDILFRVLRKTYGKENVTYIRNITDVDDKINKRAKEQNISIEDLTRETTAMFHMDMDFLHCLSPNIEPRATKHIESMVNTISSLIENKHAYVDEGHVMFATDSDPNYGHLSNRTRDEMIAGARIEISPHKKDPADFVLWKPSSSDEPGWDSPWGRGRPGWHIECTAMSTEYLGDDFDIHGGGADLQFPHHENEIAQSCCAKPGSKFAHYWVHNGFLTVGGEKMSKSLGNFITVHDLQEKQVKGEVIRYVLLATHYKKPLDWTEKAYSDGQKAMDSFYKVLKHIDGSDCDKELIEQFSQALADDLNTPQAFALLHQLVSKAHKAEGNELTLIANTLKKCGQILGFFNENSNTWFKIEQNDEVETLIAERIQAKKDKDWSKADSIRNELTSQGIILEDNPDGTTSWRKS